MIQSRRQFLQTSVAAAGLLPMSTIAQEEGENSQLLDPIHDAIVCPWTPLHPRHDHQLIFRLDDDRMMLVWCEYVDADANPHAKIGSSGATDEVSCRIASMISADRGRTWGDHRVLQPNEWTHNVKHPNLVRLSDREILFSYVGWDSAENRNVFMRRSLDNGETWGEQVQISEPGWYCNNADRALRLSTGRVILPAHGPYAEDYIGGAPYEGGNLHSFVFYSDDGFKTWKRSSDSMTAKGRGCHEPTIVELKDGRLYCLLRNTNHCQYYSISEDGGDHWTAPAPTALASPESPALLKRIPSTGDILVLWNNVASKSNWPRTPLTAAISKDDCQTWTRYHDIDNRPNFDAAYPSCTFAGDEAFIAYYTRDTEWKRDTEITLRIYDVERFYR